MPQVRTSQNKNATASQLPPLSAEDLWSLDRLGTPSLSPDGRQLVCSLSRGTLERRHNSLWLMDCSGERAPRALTVCGERDGQPAWSPRGDAIAFLSRREQQGEKDARPQLYLIAPDGGEARRLSDFAPGIESFRWLPDGSGLIFSAWVWPGLRGAAAQQREHRRWTERQETGYRTEEVFYRHWDHNIPMDRVLHLWHLDIASGRLRDLFEGTALELPRSNGGAGDYAISPDGRHLAFVHDPASVQRGGQPWALSELDLRSRRCRRLIEDPAWDIASPSYSGDGRALAFTAAHVGRHEKALAQPALLRFDARHRSLGWRALGGADWDLDAGAPRWAEADQALLFTAQQQGRCHLWRLDLGSGDCRVLQPGGWVQGFDVGGPDGGQIVSASDSARHPVRLNALRAGEAPRRLERFNDELLAQRRLGELREVWFEGAQGDAVQMWLTLPVAFSPRRRHPLLHVIHGGPFAAAGDTFSYRWNPHVLAARGHVVAQVNYHGSSGFGFAFRDSIMGRQGELESQDIEAASDWLLAQPWADGRRLSATGGSYGGFLVAWLNGHVAPGRYRSYVCHAGVFDRIATFSADSYMQRPRDLKARYWEDMPRVLAQSPHAFANTMQTPTLVIHGAQDYRVPDCNGLAYYNTLKARGVPARLLWFPDENHWVLKPRNSVLWYREFLDWVQRWEAPAAHRRG
ncbi:UNVERIFIED_ORG: S9 family peptidase [Shinella sp. XGS7]|nr:S9 family peptidase [Shinella sp. XGS7]